MIRSTVLPLYLNRNTGANCEQCAAACPQGAISIDRNNQLKIDLPTCERGQTFCGLSCMYSCPQSQKADLT